MVSRRQQALRAEAAELRQAGAPSVHVIAADLATPTGVEMVLAETSKLPVMPVHCCVRLARPPPYFAELPATVAPATVAFP